MGWDGASGWHPSLMGVIPPPITSVNVDNTVFVMKNGDDGTGVRERFDLPFLTIGAAKAAALAGDTIWVYAGIYDEKDLLKDDVNYYFDVGAIIGFTGADAGAIFDDGVNGAGGVVTCDIDGYGSFTRGGVAAADANVINIDNSSSISFRCMLMNATGGKTLIDIDAVNCVIQLLEILELGDANNGKALIVGDAERVLIKNCELVGSVDASLVDISGGNVEINDSRVENLNAGVSADVIDKTGGTLIVDDIIIVAAAAGVNSILDSTGAPREDVLVYGGVANVPVDAASINQQVNSLTIDSNVT